MEGALAPLALHPQIRVILLINAHLLLALDVYHFLLRLASIAQHLFVVGEYVLAT